MWMMFLPTWQRQLLTSGERRRLRAGRLTLSEILTILIVFHQSPYRTFIIESINDQLKNIQQIAHTRHRSVINALFNVLAALVAYTYQPSKPSLNLTRKQLILLSSQDS